MQLSHSAAQFLTDWQSNPTLARPLRARHTPGVMRRWFLPPDVGALSRGYSLWQAALPSALFSPTSPHPSETETAGPPVSYGRSSGPWKKLLRGRGEDPSGPAVVARPVSQSYPGLETRGFLRCSKPPAGGRLQKNGRAERVRKPAVCKRAPRPLSGQTRSELGSTPAQPNRHIMLCPVCHKPQDILSAHLRRVCMKRETPEAISAALNKAKVDTREHLKTGMVWSYGLICSIMGDANPVSRMVEELQRRHNVVTNLPPQLPYANVTGRPSSSTPPQPAETAAPETGESEQSDHASVSSGEMFQW
ncbi:hypothetical protein AAFF_G00390860 [Aldrovandia affinis]|uniref:Uncharacterized protein n=1 Tax=Aldrovandia affinis TaxID=143900 RepID=A0AAD7R484_9TELE|nr:hypothetical protein AAFF_G00390860 [Aldrovandia affinis]